MSLALKQAQKAAAKGEVPVGCVIVRENKILSCGYNRREGHKNPLEHAEIIAIRRAAKKLKGWRLLGCRMYVTLEPCPMCAGAIINARIPRVVFGAKDAKAGSCGSVVDLFALPYNHKPEVVSGVLGEECAQLLSDFFLELRRSKERRK